MDFYELARKHAIKNALEYGRASRQAVVSKVIAEAPRAKNEIHKLLKAVEKAVEDVNELSTSEIEKEVTAYKFEEKKEEKKKIELENAVVGKVVTRFLPEPNGLLHIGHAKAAWLSRQAASDWGGKCLLRFDDTNPETEEKQFVQAIKEDLEWLGIEFDGSESYASDLMSVFYKYAEKLIAGGNAYVCECELENIKENREKMKACACAGKHARQNLEEWKKMFSSEYKQGSAILRLRGDMRSLNTVMRDPTLFRIIEAPHYRQGRKYRVWPTYDFEVSIADSLAGVTHALRSKEYELRDELYYKILELLRLRMPMVYDFARLSIKGTLLSKRFLKPLIEKRKVMGWDDPRLPTLRGLKRRGILPGAIKKFVLSFGLSKVETKPSWDALLGENRRLLDAQAEHYFFVAKPQELVVEDVPPNLMREIELPKHQSEEKGERKLRVDSRFFIPGDDAKQMRIGETIRLKELYNVRIKEKTLAHVISVFAGIELVEGSKKIQWVPAERGEFVEASLLVPSDLLNEKGEFNERSLQEIKGVCEKTCLHLKQGQAIQFERVGFARLDDAKKMRFVLCC